MQGHLEYSTSPHFCPHTLSPSTSLPKTSTRRRSRQSCVTACPSNQLMLQGRVRAVGGSSVSTNRHEQRQKPLQASPQGPSGLCMECPYSRSTWVGIFCSRGTSSFLIVKREGNWPRPYCPGVDDTHPTLHTLETSSGEMTVLNLTLFQIKSSRMHRSGPTQRKPINPWHWRCHGQLGRPSQTFLVASVLRTLRTASFLLDTRAGLLTTSWEMRWALCVCLRIFLLLCIFDGILYLYKFFIQKQL